jgi:hypothetical protein
MGETLIAPDNIMAGKIETLHERLRSLEAQRLQLQEAMRKSDNEGLVDELRERTGEITKEAQQIITELKNIKDPVYLK